MASIELAGQLQQHVTGEACPSNRDNNWMPIIYVPRARHFPVTKQGHVPSPSCTAHLHRNRATGPTPQHESQRQLVASTLVMSLSRQWVHAPHVRPSGASPKRANPREIGAAAVATKRTLSSTRPGEALVRKAFLLRIILHSGVFLAPRALLLGDNVASLAVVHPLPLPSTMAGWRV